MFVDPDFEMLQEVTVYTVYFFVKFTFTRNCQSMLNVKEAIVVEY